MKSTSPTAFCDLVTVMPAARRLLSSEFMARCLVRFWTGDRGLAYGLDIECMGCYIYNDNADEFWIEEDLATGELCLRIPRLDKRRVRG